MVLYTYNDQIRFLKNTLKEFLLDALRGTMSDKLKLI